MLDRLIDFLLNFLDDIIPFKVVKQWQHGVRFRFGKIKLPILSPGLHFKIPFADDISNHATVVTTISLEPQSLCTKDGKNIVVKAHVKYRIIDLESYATKIWDAPDALIDVTAGIIYEKISKLEYKKARETNLSALITPDARNEALPWGVYIEKVTITDFAEMRSYRLFTNERSVPGTT